MRGKWRQIDDCDLYRVTTSWLLCIAILWTCYRVRANRVSQRRQRYPIDHKDFARLHIDSDQHLPGNCSESRICVIIGHLDIAVYGKDVLSNQTQIFGAADCKVSVFRVVRHPCRHTNHTDCFRILTIWHLNKGIIAASKWWIYYEVLQRASLREDFNRVYDTWVYVDREIISDNFVSESCLSVVVWHRYTTFNRDCV